MYHLDIFKYYIILFMKHFMKEYSHREYNFIHETFHERIHLYLYNSCVYSCKIL